MGLISAIYSVQPNIFKLVSFQHVISMKELLSLFTQVSFWTQDLKPVCVGHLSHLRSTKHGIRARVPHMAVAPVLDSTARGRSSHLRHEDLEPKQVRD